MKIKVTDDGGDIHEIDTSTDVGGAILLLEYARARNFRLGPTIQVGTVILQVRDMRQESNAQTAEPIDPDFLRIIGGGDT